MGLHKFIDGLRTKLSDSEVLRMSTIIHRDKLEELHDATQFRLYIVNSLKTLAEEGKVAIVVGGLDCDCVSYEGHVYHADADSKSLDLAVQSIIESAEGPVHWSIMSLSQAKNIKRSSIDLAMMAFENGHPHVVYY